MIILGLAVLLGNHRSSHQASAQLCLFSNFFGHSLIFQLSKQMFSFHKQNSFGLVGVFSHGTYFLCLMHIYFYWRPSETRCPTSSVCPQILIPAGLSFGPTHCLHFYCLSHVWRCLLVFYFLSWLFFSILFLSILSKNTVYLDQKEAFKLKFTMLSCLQVSFSIYSFHLIHKSQPVIKDSSVLN